MGCWAGDFRPVYQDISETTVYCSCQCWSCLFLGIWAMRPMSFLVDCPSQSWTYWPVWPNPWSSSLSVCMDKLARLLQFSLPGPRKDRKHQNITGGICFVELCFHHEVSLWKQILRTFVALLLQTKKFPRQSEITSCLRLKKGKGINYAFDHLDGKHRRWDDGWLAGWRWWQPLMYRHTSLSIQNMKAPIFTECEMWSRGSCLQFARVADGPDLAWWKLVPGL